MGRVGGEEFVVILSETSLDGGVRVGEAMRAAVEAMQIAHPASRAACVVTVSVGVASASPADGITPKDLLARADDALYESKSRGRNRVTVAGDACVGSMLRPAG